MTAAKKRSAKVVATLMNSFGLPSSSEDSANKARNRKPPTRDARGSIPMRGRMMTGTARRSGIACSGTSSPPSSIRRALNALATMSRTDDDWARWSDQGVVEAWERTYGRLARSTVALDSIRERQYHERVLTFAHRRVEGRATRRFFKEQPWVFIESQPKLRRPLR